MNARMLKPLGALALVACSSLTEESVAIEGDDDSVDAQAGELNAAAIDKGIEIDKSILGIEYGMAADQLRASLGAPTTFTRDYLGSAGRKIYTYDATSIALSRDDYGTWRVLSIVTRAPELKTSKGIGVGSSERDLRWAHWHGKCRDIAGSRECSYGGQDFHKRMTFAIDREGKITSVFLGAIVD